MSHTKFLSILMLSSHQLLGFPSPFKFTDLNYLWISHLVNLIALTLIGEEYKLGLSLTRNFLRPAMTCCLLGPNNLG
jgi:hypothetical protein